MTDEGRSIMTWTKQFTRQNGRVSERSVRMKSGGIFCVQLDTIYREARRIFNFTAGIIVRKSTEYSLNLYKVMLLTFSESFRGRCFNLWRRGVCLIPQVLYFPMNGCWCNFCDFTKMWVLHLAGGVIIVTRLSCHIANRLTCQCTRMKINIHSRSAAYLIRTTNEDHRNCNPHFSGCNVSFGYKRHQ